MKKLVCREAGFDCDAVVTGATDEEVIRKAREHGAQKHNMQQMSPDQERALRARIKTA
jgi:predicted small metal-binding protein